MIPDIQSRIQRGQLQHRRRADPHSFDAGTGLVGQIEGEGRGVAQPSRQGGAGRFGVARGHIDKGRAAGTGVQVFIGASDREIGAAIGQMHGKGARAMGQIPDREDAFRLCRTGQGRHVMFAPRPVIDLGQHQHGDRIIQRIGHIFGGDRLEAVIWAQSTAQALGHIEIGGEVAGIGQNNAALWVHLEGRGHRLIDLDRQRVAKHNAARLCPDQPGDPVANAGGLVHPARLVPSGDQQFAPFLGHAMGNAGGGRLWQGAKRIAIQIDDPFRQVELGAGGGEIGCHGDPLMTL